MAVWMPVTVVPRSAATVAMDTFITALSRIMMNWAAHSTSSTNPAPLATASLDDVFMSRISLVNIQCLFLKKLMDTVGLIASTWP